MNIVSEQSSPSNRAWYQHRMMLLVVGIPLLSVVVSFTFLGIAIVTFDGVVVGDYYKQGKEINRILARDEMAAKLGLQAQIEFAGGQLTVAVTSDSQISWPEKLSLDVLHPTQDGYDLTVELNKVATLEHSKRKQVYSGNYASFKNGERILLLESQNWRLMHRSAIDPDSSIVVTGM